MILNIFQLSTHIKMDHGWRCVQGEGARNGFYTTLDGMLYSQFTRKPLEIQTKCIGPFLRKFNINAPKEHQKFDSFNYLAAF